MKQICQHLVLARAAMNMSAACGAAEDFPGKPIELIVGYVPGGSPDRIARLLGKRRSQILGQPFIIENKPGAGATLATRQSSARRPTATPC